LFVDNATMGLVLLLATFLLALVCTAGARAYAIKQNVLDVPNARSSHVVPVPRGGGLAIVLSYLLAVLSLCLMGVLPQNLGWALVGAGGGAALIGFLDDHGHIAARWRLLAHFICATWVLAWLAPLPVMYVAGYTLIGGWPAYIVAALFLVWMLNLYNFMDGIDGIASVQAISVGAGGALLYYWSGDMGHTLACVLLAAATAGFLVWNFPPARIFMGDVGSGFLGLIIGILTIDSARTDMNLLWGFLILSAVFIVDATLTLVRRLCRGERVYQAHCSHAYQYAARKYAGHLPVTLGVLAINLLWLTPWALAASLDLLSGWIALLAAYLPLVGLAAKFDAGKPTTVVGGSPLHDLND
jgi:Fuc2NAc and GlcNAc transferase